LFFRKEWRYKYIVVEIRQLSANEACRYVGQLADVLIDCVEGGASVSFMAPLSRAAAEAFFGAAVDEVERGNRILLAAFTGGRLAGTVQVLTAMPPNQPHRAEIAKLLVLRSARGRGVAAQLMLRAEDAARGAGKTLLTLDTVTGEAGERVYLRLGWTKAGVIPNYALFPDGRPCSTTIFWKDLRAETHSEGQAKI
jgi:GNAT superfamily N-acetyltransferase